MTIEQHMLTRPGRSRSGRPQTIALATMLAAFIGGLHGCAKDDLRLPRTLVSPYVAEREDVLWAVTPLRNESGVSVVDPLLVSDALVAQLEEVRGIRAIPMNRVIGAMRMLGLAAVERPADGLRLAGALGADAVVVGTITAWDPYSPPKIGLSLTLFGASERFGTLRASTSVDPRALRASGTEYTIPPGPWRNRGELTSTASDHIDGANHEVQFAVRAFAEGRHEPASALGWKRYLSSMTLFTEFACHRLTERLLDAERIRLAQSVAQAPPQ